MKMMEGREEKEKEKEKENQQQQQQQEEEEEEESESLLMGARRIFVGGLVGSITEADLEKTFSSLGTVEGVDLIRTNGRSFAYINFQPSSVKSLNKLFSTYNGCIWKGGRLRLENAKEHYLVRLKREWEDAKQACKTSNELEANEKVDGLEQSKLLIPEKTQLRIFFPRLRKVKSLPYSGTGKHKYSFQRIEVPSLPIHFCDCEEHYGASETANEKPPSVGQDETGLLDEGELNMMRSVMNNIFKKEVNSSTENGRNIVAKEVGNNKPPINTDTVPFSADEMEQETDEDNLVINVLGGNNRLDLLENQVQQKINQEPGKKTQNKIKAQKGKNVDSLTSPHDNSKKSHSGKLQINGDELTLGMTKKKRQHLEMRAEESMDIAEVQSPQLKKQSAKGLFWKQKSSWKEMVGETKGVSFSISQILTGGD